MIVKKYSRIKLKEYYDERNIMDLSNENILHVKENEIEYLQFKKLLEFNNVINCYTLKTNNVDFNRCEDEKNIKTSKESYNKICKAMQIDESTIVRPFQKHTDKVEIANNLDSSFKNVDGLITNKKNINLMLTYADCTPIILFDPIKNVIANIHSGWRGTVQKIGQKGAIKLIKTFDVRQENLLAFIGPCIGKCHFEVDIDVKDAFEQVFGYLNRNYDIIKSKENETDKFLIDTTLINRLLLEEIGILPNNIYESNICTVCNSKRIHSFRADKDTGRNVAIIGLK